MTWHIIGGNSYIAQRLLPKLNGEHVVTYGRSRENNQVFLDLTDIDPNAYKEIKNGDFVVFFAAVSSPDICQKQYDSAYALNVTGTEIFIQGCLKTHAKVLFFSSDAVLGTASGDETAEPSPIGNYAKMKRIVETDFCGEKDLKVFRLSYVFSRQDKFTRYLRECQRNNTVANVYDALYRNVVYIEDLIDAITALSKSFDRWENQIFHICGDELLSRKDIAEIYRKETGGMFQYITSIPDSTFFEARPNRIEMKSKYFSSLLGKTPTRIAEAMHLEAERIG
ncbi:MAG: sugar nucleotide-binding protein [Anaerolineaceae bacterium]|nr:sugar nucleotide-binding protein [Anaerolineaceae bacterium]